MTNIRNTTTGELVTIECRVDGIDILGDVMGGCGVDVACVDDHGVDFALAEDEIEWWQCWAEREERICEAYADADEDTRKRYEQAISEYGHDMQLLQDELETILGI